LCDPDNIQNARAFSIVIPSSARNPYGWKKQLHGAIGMLRSAQHDNAPPWSGHSQGYTRNQTATPPELPEIPFALVTKQVDEDHCAMVQVSLRMKAGCAWIQ
jgi:hypothetical protein